MDLISKRHYSVPVDLAALYDEKIAGVDKWLEDELIARGIQPAIFRFIRREDNEKGKLARKE